MKRFALSGFGLGFLPPAPGTWGSLLPVVIFMVLSYLPMVPAAITMAVLLGIAIASSAVCLLFTGTEQIRCGKNDPGHIVADEIAGQSLALLPVVMIPEINICTAAVAGFVLFRLFDILKPWPIKKLESLPRGWGVLADDLLAGIYAGIILSVLVKIGLINFLARLCSLDFGSLNFSAAVILGAVQGLTEFLPVSSSGHLVLLEKIFHLDPETPQMLLFDLSIHTGTVLAIFIVFRKSILAFIKNLLSSGKYGPGIAKIYKKSPSVHIVVLAMIATFATGIAGLPLKSFFESAYASLPTVAAMWVITGTVLLIADSRKKTRMGLRQFGIIAAVIIGLAQAAAIMPGISRSGSTICAAILIGLHRRWAVEFSFLIAIPAILGATILEAISNIDQITSASLPAFSFIIGPVTAAIVGVFALKILINFSRKARLKIFAFYCYALAILVFGYLLQA